MKTLNKILSAVAALLNPRATLAANEQAANENPVPMVGEQFDFRKMVLNLLGANEETTNEELSGLYSSCMACDPGDPKLKANEKALEDAEAKLTAANAELAKRGEVKLKVAGKEITVALAANGQDGGLAEALAAANAALDEQAGKLAKAEADLKAANGEATKHQAAFANERQARRKAALGVLVANGRLTKAQAEAADADLQKPEFANSEQFDAKLAELAKAGGLYASNSTLDAMFGELGESVANRNTDSKKASADFAALVANEQAATGLDYTSAWAKVKASDKGKALFAQMQSPK